MKDRILELLNSTNPDDKKLGFMLLGKLTWEEAREICNMESKTSIQSYTHYYIWDHSFQNNDDNIYKFSNFCGVFGDNGIGINKVYKESNSYPGPEIDMT